MGILDHERSGKSTEDLESFPSIRGERQMAKPHLIMKHIRCMAAQHNLLNQGYCPTVNDWFNAST